MHRLTPMTYEIARLAAAGVSRSEIARRLGRDLAAINGILSGVYRRFGIHSRRELAEHLLRCEVREWDGGGRPSSHGYRPGDAFTVTGGRFAGRVAVYVGGNNSNQVRVQIGGGTFAVNRKFLQREAA